MMLLIMFLTLLTLCSGRYHNFRHNSRTAACECTHRNLCPYETITGVLDPRAGNRICPDPEEICCNSAPSKPTESETSPCGISLTTRITSGSNAAFGELPWNLIVQEYERNLYKCGASLIHPKIALTAAHCVSSYSQEPEKLLIRAGEWNVDSRDEVLPFQDNFVEEILIYYDYDPMSLKSDVAILVLSGEFQLTDNVGVICLATTRHRVVENRCVASGWGKDALDGSYASTMKKVQIPLVPRSECLETLRSTRLGPKFVLHKSFVCAGGKKGRDACKGDGGSPLVCPLVDENERFVQVGIVSWGIGCGNEHVPGVYVNVPLYLDWIETEMRERDLDTSYFKV